MRSLYFIISTLLTISVIIVFALSCTTTQKTGYIEKAEQTAEWISSTGIPAGNMVYYPSQPDTMQRGEISLYHGVPGTTLFFLEMYKATGSAAYADEAHRAARWLISRANAGKKGFFWTDYTPSSSPVPYAGLYSGTAGVGTAFLNLGIYLENDEYLQYARGAADWLTENMAVRQTGGAWNSSNDIISGAAGTGLYLLKAAEYFNDGAYLNAAMKAGDHLISLGIEDAPGVKWKAFAQTTKIYPNFSHGTSGIAYYMARLYQLTGEKRYLDAALSGAEWLLSHEEEHEGDGCAWYHHEPDGKDLYYVGWCHGPGGTAKLFYQLYLVTGGDQWMQMVKEAAQWLMTCGLNEKPLDGYWNISVCCGNAGIADFLADLYRVTGDKTYWEFAVTMVDDMMKKAVPGNPGLKFMVAEHRTKPEEEYCQTGYSQGAAGIGLTFLKMYAFSHEKPPFTALTLPDSPFTWQ